jgi:superfamily II DNA/RNA helicase
VFHEVASKDATVEEMRHHFFHVHQMDKIKVAASIARGAGRTLMFVRTKRGADRLVSDLRREGVRSGAIHGDLRQGAREKALADFSDGKLAVLVATDVAARGIHVDDIDVVVHYDPADDHKTYLHRSGRTARAGDSGVVITLSLWNQENEVRVVQRRLNLQQPIEEIFSNDERLAELTRAEPSAVA